MNKSERYDIAKNIAQINDKLRVLQSTKEGFSAALMRALCRLAEPQELYADGLKASVIKPTQLVRDEKAYKALAKGLGFKTPEAFDERIKGCLVRVPATEYLKVL